MEHDLTEEKIRPVSTRFELAVRRMIEGWVTAGRVRVSRDEVELAREYLEAAGCRVEQASGALMRLVSREGRSQDLSPEATVVAAMRRLAASA